MENNNFRVSLYRILKPLSATLDLISKIVVDHHRTVTYISYMLGKGLKLPRDQLRDLVIASLIHDIGTFQLNQDIADLSFDNNDRLHAEVGYLLLKNYFPLPTVPEIIRHHHREWQDYSNKFQVQQVSVLCHILFLADRIATLIDNQKDIFAQVKSIEKRISDNSGRRFWPMAVKAFLRVSKKEYFWLNIINSAQMGKVLDENEELYYDYIDLDQLINLSEIISHITDFRSPFTATHSAGTAFVAEELARWFHLSAEECKMMRIAGFTHDIGKLAVPLEILNKTGKLNEREWEIMKSHAYYTYLVLSQLEELKTINHWASYHHETLRGDGYPFHLDKPFLPLGSRIMSVADVFTAITEDRPYRKGMNQDEVLKILEEMATNNIIDQEITAVITSNYSYFNKIREKAQKKPGQVYRQFKLMIEKKRKEQLKST